MKDWWIIVTIVMAVLYVSSAISASENRIATALAKLTESVEELGNKAHAIAEKVDQLEDEVSGKNQKWKDKIDDLYGH